MPRPDAPPRPARSLARRVAERVRRLGRRAPAPPESGGDGRGESRRAAAVATRTEAARALAYFETAGVRTVVVDASPDDATPAACRAAHGWTYTLGAARGLLPHVVGPAACRCRLRAAPDDEAGWSVPPPRPADAVWRY